MKLISWQFKGLKIPMIKTEDGDLLCTSAGLCSALGLTAGGLRKVLHDHRQALLPEVVTNRNDLAPFIRTHLNDLGLRARQAQAGMLVWPLRQALKVAYLAHTDVSWEFIEASIDLVEQNAIEGHATREEFVALEQRCDEWERVAVNSQERADDLQERLDRLEQIVFESKTSLELAASAAGRSLAAQRGTKGIRTVN